MPSEKDHLDCANRTQETIKTLLADNRQLHSPWIATAAFYKALHIVEAVFSNDSRISHTANHDERDAALKTSRKYENIFKNYIKLKRASMNARYLSNCSVFDDYLSDSEVEDKLLRHGLKQVENSAQKFLANPSDLNSIDTAFQA